MSNWDKILKDFSHKCKGGAPNLKNSTHLQFLRESLIKFGWTENATNEFIGNLREGKFQALSKKGNVSTFDTADNRDAAIKKGTHKPIDDKSSETGGEEELKKDKDEKEEEPAQRIYQNKNPIDFENDSIEDIARKTSNGEYKRTSTEEARQQTQDNRAEVFGGKTGKGGGQTTVQEEMGNMAKELGFKNPDMTDQEIEDAIMKEIQEKYPDSKWAKNEKKSRGLIKKSTGGADTAREIINDESFDYNKEQPEGYPATTTEGVIVRNSLLTKYEEAKKAGDTEKMKHYEEELKWFQKKAGDKSITGTEGDADTMVMYEDNNGNMRVAYVTNKQSENDMISNSTISSVTKATEASAVEGADVSSVVRVQRAAMETGQGFNNKYVKKSQEVIENNRQALKDDADIIGKASTASSKSGRSEFHDEKPNKKYLQDNLKNKTVLANLEKAGVDVEEAKKNPEKYADEIMQASLDAHGTGVEGIGTGSQGVAYSTVKATKVTRSIREKVTRCMGGDESKLKECCKKVSESKGKSGSSKGKPLYNGAFSADDIERIMNNKGLEQLEDEHIKRDRSMDDMYEQSVNRLREIDLQYWMDEEGLSEEEALERMKTEPGPNERSYTAGFLQRTHLHDYITGSVDGRVLGEMGKNSHSPQRIRQALAELLKYEGDINDGDAFLDHVLKNVRADHENQTLTYIDAQGNNVQIGIDDHRLAGRGEKMAGRFGLQLANKLKEIAERE